MLSLFRSRASTEYLRINGHYLPGRDLHVRPLIVQVGVRTYFHNHSLKSEPCFKTNNDLATNAYLEAYVLPMEKYYSAVIDMDTKRKKRV